MSRSVPSTRVGYLDVLRVAEFRVLLGVQLLRAVATTTEILGLSVLVFVKTGSALLSAIAYGIGFLPQLVGGAFLTALADRLPARPLIVSLLLVRALPGALIGLLPLPVAGMLLLMAAAGCLDPVSSAASGATVRGLLTGDHYVLGRSMLSSAASAAQIVGLAAGGVVLAVLPARQLLLVSAAALVLGGLWARAGLRSRPVTRVAGSVGAVRSSLHGNRILLADPRVRGLLFAQWLPPAVVTGAESLLVSYVVATGRSAHEVSALLIAVPIGMLVGDVVVGRFVRPSTREQLSLPLAVLTGVPLLAFAFSLPLVMAAALLLLTGVGFAYLLGLQRPFAEALPEERAGQAFGLLSSGLMGVQGLGPVGAGVVAGGVGPGAAIATGGAAVLAGCWLLWSSLTGRPPRRTASVECERRDGVTAVPGD